MGGNLATTLRRRIPEIGILINTAVLIIGYYYLTVIKAELPEILSATKHASLELWGSVLYIFDVLLAVSLIIQLIIFFGKMAVIKLGFESQ